MIHIESGVLQAAMARAAETGREVHEVVEEALRHYLDKSTPPSLANLRRHRDQFLHIAASHGTHNLRVFGSVARGEATPDSDADFLVDLDPDRTLIDLSGLILDLQDALGRRVDVVEVKKASRTADRITREAVPL